MGKSLLSQLLGCCSFTVITAREVVVFLHYCNYFALLQLKAHHPHLRAENTYREMQFADFICQLTKGMH